jgi:hypothetical protein
VTKRVLLDEGVPRHLAAPLEAVGFPVTPYPQSWKQTKNGELLELAERHGYDILITSDKNMYAQQNLRGRNISIVVIPTNLRRQVMERAADIIDTVARIKPRQYVVIELSGRRLMFDFDNPGAAPVDMPAVKPWPPSAR